MALNFRNYQVETLLMGYYRFFLYSIFAIEILNYNEMRKVKFNSVFTAILMAVIFSMILCCKPNNRVVCGDKSYVFRVGEIISDSETNTTTIQLLTDGQLIRLLQFKTSNGGWSEPASPIKMKIIIEDKTIECSNDIGITNKGFIFTFETLDMPEKIIVYSNDGAKSKVAYDGKTKEVTFVD